MCVVCFDFYFIFSSYYNIKVAQIFHSIPNFDTYLYICFPFISFCLLFGVEAGLFFSFPFLLFPIHSNTHSYIVILFEVLIKNIFSEGFIIFGTLVSRARRILPIYTERVTTIPSVCRYRNHS